MSRRRLPQAASNQPHPEESPVVFPPPHDYSSLSIKDLLDAREEYRVYLSSLQNVIGTAVGRYYIHEKDWYATHSPLERRPDNFARVHTARTLSNSVICPWSWPAVLVFVKQWEQVGQLKTETIPRTLYLPDGRTVPTCVMELTPDESAPGASLGPVQTSELMGGGYSCLREHQGMTSLGTVACLVKKGGNYYALTNRHVAGGKDEIVSAFVRGNYKRIGVTSDHAIERTKMSNVFPRWPGDHVFLNLDAGLIKIDDINDWTAQYYGVGEIDEVFDATEFSLTLDMINCPVRTFGATSGVSEGRIAALFFRYATQNSYDYVSDVLVGPRRHEPAGHGRPITRQGDSGAIWFFDGPAYQKQLNRNPKDFDAPNDYTAEGRRARRYRPIAMQWGGERVLVDGTTTAYSLATFVSTICRIMDVELYRDWSLGHEETDRKSVV